MVRIATTTGQAAMDFAGWSAELLEFSYDDPGKTVVHVHSHPLKSGQTLRLPRGNWTGAILILDDTL